MTADALSDDFARDMRRSWFAYLDVVEPIRPELHRYCLKLTGDVWSAEDLVQDTLLRGYGGMGRGDMHGEGSPVRSAKAYLFRIASNHWIDAARKASREARAEMEPTRPAATAEAAIAVREAGAILMTIASPQERAAVVLKDAFDFDLAEIAELLSTSVGAVKSALHRGRARLAARGADDAPGGASRALVDRFVAAFNARDVPAVTALLLETVTIEVHGVGGGRGREGIWVASTLADPLERAERRDFHGEAIVLHFKGAGDAQRLTSLTRLDEDDGGVSRIRDYCYCPDTLAAVADELGLPVERTAYHQQPETLVRMIATTTLPWRHL
jgi:RNA polymerase sigma-70 factor (ECF subfamily)